MKMNEQQGNNEEQSSQFHRMKDDDEEKTFSHLEVANKDIHGSNSESNTLNDDWFVRRTVVISALYMSVFAIAGAFLRIAMAQLFGLECANPGTVGWLKAGEPLCVTADGGAEVKGGIIFADLPANLLGSFVMGLMQTTGTMNLPKAFPIAWLRADHPFQGSSIIHLAIRTGFCGSLTTFSSWNSEMVVMMLGIGQNVNRGSLFFRGLLGYLIGVETALASFVLGKNLAKYIHNRVNPALHVENEQMKLKQKCGTFINTQLSDYERRFLSDYNMGEFDQYIDLCSSEFLSEWRISTERNRRVGDSLLPLLKDIEYEALVLGNSLEKENTMSAIEAGWNIEALDDWVNSKKNLHIQDEKVPSTEFKMFPAVVIFMSLGAILVAGLVFVNSDDAYSTTYRTMIYSGIFAPSGALLRWKLSGWNGTTITGGWFPLGTFIANLLACIISTTTIGLEYQLLGSNNFWAIGTVRAIKIGFSGCLSTVSTFISEVNSFLHSSQSVRGYIYITTTLTSCFTFGALFYYIFSNIH